MSIKYYHLAKDEELPDEFCAVRDVGGEPSEYTFYVPESENAKLRELVRDMLDVMLDYRCDIRMPNSLDYSNEPAVFKERARELGVDVD